MTGKILKSRYKLIEKLGGGGMAIVYKAEDTYLGRPVTVKILRSEYAGDEVFVSRFKKEAQSVARLSHPNIINIHDVGEEDDIHYLVMEYVEGKDLKTIIRNDAPLPLQQVVSLAGQVCDALKHAHENYIIHRDVKPHNILVTPEGKAKLTDFGIAKEVTTSTLTYGSHVMGSVHYISPEQARGKTAGPVSDIYSLGIVIYEMLTGALPFEGDTPVGVAMKHIQEDTIPLDELRTEVSGALARVVHKALEKNPEQRFQSAGEFKNALLEAVNNPEVSTVYDEKMKTMIVPPVNGTGSKKKKSKKTRLLLIVVPVMLLFFVSAGVYAFNQYLNVPDITVPDVTGKTEEEAKEILQEEDLKAKVVDEVFDEQEEGTVVSQSIGPEDYPVKPGREIELTLSKGPDLRKVPDLRGKTLNRARSELISKNLVLDNPVEEEYSDDVQKGRVISQSPPPNSLKEKGSKVKITVSAGKEPGESGIPDLVGKDKDEALSLLKEKGIDFSINWEKSVKYSRDKVISQTPEPGSEAGEDPEVELVLSSGPGPGEEQVRLDISEEIPRDGDPHDVKVMVEDEKGNHVEYTGTHTYKDSVDRTIKFYKSAEIKIYIDNKLVKTKIVG